MKQHVSKSSLALAAAILILIVAGAFRSSDKTTPLEQITNDYKTNLTITENKLVLLNNETVLFEQGKSSIEKIKTQYLEVRKSFKTVEFLLDYLDPQSVKYLINGAPLPKLEPSTTVVKVIEPTGMQVVDELVFSGEATAVELKKEVGDLLNNFRQVNKFQQAVTITERQLFEAARFQLTRVATMGITGFDTPGSHNALTDAKNALLPLLKLARLYSATNTKDELQKKLEGAITYLETNTDFDSFNRFEFIKEYINPAFKLFNDRQVQLGIETIYEVNSFSQPVNYNANTIFSPDFLNPSYFSNTADKKINPDKAHLGKLLFFDPILSGNNKRSCASCHNPIKAFTDGNARSIAMDFEGTVTRNAPTLINSVFAERYFYDMRAERIENQFEHVITSNKEFNTSYPEIASKLEQSDEYKSLFAQAFPNFNGQISRETVSEAIGAYIKTLTAFNSEFDKNIRGEVTTLSPSAINGFNLFMGKAVCATCHFAPTFAGLVPPFYYESESEVLGVPATKDTLNPALDADAGRVGGLMLEKAAFNKHSFKTMTVRNIALTAPYMHNGVYTTLEEVVDFYNKGGGQGLGIHLENQTLPFDSLSLNATEKRDLIAFMQSLTDTAGLTAVPQKLPAFKNQAWNTRKVGGEY